MPQLLKEKKKNSSRSLLGFALIEYISSNRDGSPSSSHHGLHFHKVFLDSFSKGKRSVFSKVMTDIRILVLCLAYLKEFCSESYVHLLGCKGYHLRCPTQWIPKQKCGGTQSFSKSQTNHFNNEPQLHCVTYIDMCQLFFPSAPRKREKCQS